MLQIDRAPDYMMNRLSFGGRQKISPRALQTSYVPDEILSKHPHMHPQQVDYQGWHFRFSLDSRDINSPFEIQLECYDRPPGERVSHQRALEIASFSKKMLSELGIAKNDLTRHTKIISRPHLVCSQEIHDTSLPIRDPFTLHHLIRDLNKNSQEIWEAIWHLSMKPALLITK